MCPVRFQSHCSALSGAFTTSAAGARRILEIVTSLSTDIDFAAVSQPDPDAVVDPNWLRLRGDSLLPTLYMPPTMAGRQPTWMRAMAVVLIGVFLLATVLGLCLTYGPPSSGW